MNFKNILAALLLSLFSFGVVHAAGSPMHEDFTNLISLSEKMIEAGKQSDSTGFVAAANEASDAAKDQGLKGNSPILQRVGAKFKQAKKAVKGGDFPAGIKLAEDAIAEMKKEKPPVQFGGGN